MESRISGFHQDAEGHWVAELECGHQQHVRHDPPWTVREWVVTEEGRAGFVGHLLRCAACPEGAAADPRSAAFLLEALERSLHASKSEWIFLRELRVGTGHRNGSAQRLDAFALNCLPHLGMKRVCYEVKTSRGDFLNEVKRPLKRRIGMRYSNEFYFVTPGGLVTAGEIPVDCGLIEAGTASFDEWKQLIKRQAGFFYFDPASSIYCMVTVAAPWRDTPGPTWGLTAAMLRNQRRQFEERPPAPPSQARLSFR